MLGEEYQLDQAVVNGNDLPKCCITTSNIKHPILKRKKNIQIPLLLPGVSPVSNLFTFKKKLVMGGHCLVSESVAIPLMWPKGKSMVVLLSADF